MITASNVFGATREEITGSSMSSVCPVEQIFKGLHQRSELELLLVALDLDILL